MKRRPAKPTEKSVKRAIEKAAAARKADSLPARETPKTERVPKDAARRAERFQAVREAALKRWRGRED